MNKISIITSKKRQVIDITDQIQNILPPKVNGLACLFVSHTTAALSTADLDPGTDLDYLDAFEQIVPHLNYRHYHDPNHMPDHILSSMIGTSMQIPFENGKLLMGTWQRAVLFELNGPKNRDIHINIITL